MALRNVALIVACVAYVASLGVRHAAAGGRKGTLDITQHGAVGDGKTDSTKAFMKAWEIACEGSGVQKIVVPKGDYLVGALTLEGPCKSSVILRLDGNLIGTGDLSAYKTNWIEIMHVDNFAINGHGKIDGQGPSVWGKNECHKSYNCKILPNSLVLDYMTNVTIKGVSLVNSKFFHMNIFSCKNVLVEKVNISAPEESPNTDGIHIGDSTNITIKATTIATGDDCISIGPGSSHITVKGVRCGPGHGISVGSLGRYKEEKDVTDITVSNCTLKGTTNGLRIKSYEDSPSSLKATKFVYKDINMVNVLNPIIIDQKYCPNNICTKSGNSKVAIYDVTFKNIRGTSASPAAISLICPNKLPCQGVKLINIDLEYTGKDNTTMAVCSNAHGISSGVPHALACL